MALMFSSPTFLAPLNLGFPSSSPSSSKLSSSSISSIRISVPVGPVKCQAVDDVSQASAVYQGIYGPWTVDLSDVREVILYRAGLVTAATSFVIAASAAFLPENSALTETIKQNFDLLYSIGASGLGLSLLLIHIYVTPIKRTLQAFWALGVVGSLATYLNLALPAGDNLVQYVIDNPSAVWFVGPLFAALTGLVFKEGFFIAGAVKSSQCRVFRVTVGLCYGKLEAQLLTFIVPILALGHLTGLMDDGVKVTLLGSWMALFVIFAGRKFTQNIKDDIGDKSVFMFNALSEGEKEALVAKLEQQKLGENVK